MNRHKWRSLTLIIGLALVLATLVVACAKESEQAPYAPDFTLPTIYGESVTLSDFRGKPVMLTFWAIQCPSCVSQLPHIQAFYDEWSSERVALLTVDVQENPAFVHDFVSSRGLTFPVLLDPQGRVAQTYGIPGVPVTFFIDIGGIYKGHWPGPFQSADQIELALEQVFPSFTSAVKPDTTPPLISEIAVSNISDSSATVSWATDELATSHVEFGTTAAYGSTAGGEEDLVTSHSMTLTRLEPETTYHYRVRSQDASGNESTSAADHDFATLTPIQVGPEVGMRAPDFTLQTIDGETVTLSDFRGKTVMVNIWLTDCKGCVDEMVHIQAVFDEWSDEELMILAINTTDSAVTVKEFVNSRGFTFPILVDPRGQVSGDYCKFGAPTTFFIDSKGIVKAIQHNAFLSPDEIESILEAL